MEEKSSVKCFGGLQKTFSHASNTVGCTMTFGVYLPPQALAGTKCPVLYFLSGLTCTEANFIQKSGFQRFAAEHGIVVVNPDTSPRGLNIEGEEDGWDFGTGAGFYVDATEPKWTKNYRMYSYVTKELRELVNTTFPVDPVRASISGHSMGGHGALICALKNPGLYKSASAFAPISNPANCPWGNKAFTGYLGPNKESWAAWDSANLLAAYEGPRLPILADTGTADGFLQDGQLLPDSLTAAAKGKETISLENRMQDGYDHSYFFIATFLGDHFAFHAKHL